MKNNCPNNLCVVFVGLTLAAVSASIFAAAEAEKSGPLPTATNIIAEHYQVKPELVTAELIKNEPSLAVAVVHVAGRPTCTVDMAPAGEYVRAKYGWLVGGLACDRVAQPGG